MKQGCLIKTGFGTQHWGMGQWHGKAGLGKGIRAVRSAGRSVCVGGGGAVDRTSYC